MSVVHVRIGLDGISTETQECSGYAFFCLPEEAVPLFENDTRALLDSAGLRSFHGKKFRRRDADAFLSFLKLIRSFATRTPQSFATCRLFSRKTGQELLEFCTRETEKVLEVTVGPNHPALEVISPYFFPLACLAAVSRELAPQVEMRVEMDSHSSLKDLSQQVARRSGTGIRATALLKGLYNGYARYTHSRTPVLPDDGVTVHQDESSPLVQAADVVGNFAMAHIHVCVGRATRGRKLKSELLMAALGDLMGDFDPAGKIVLRGEDLVLVDEGGVTFSMRWVLTKPPADPQVMHDWPKDDGLLGNEDARRGKK